MGYRPICDVWLLAHPKVKYYGAYPAGFLERARNLLGVSMDDPVLHVCSGRVKDYPFRGFGPNDRTLDFDEKLKPDICIDLTKKAVPSGKAIIGRDWPAILVDPPYTEADAEHYISGKERLPKPGVLLRECMDVVRVGGRVGVLHYLIPKGPKNSKFIAAVGVIVGFNARIRAYSVYERIE